ncbi:hypothetical protein [Acidithiobacillus ferrivorans]|nr:hypothetical protein [Acidithiobacillus ferrivorans]
MIESNARCPPIATLTLNPAVDIAYAVVHLIADQIQKCHQHRYRLTGRRG